MADQFAIRGTWQQFGWGSQGSSAPALFVFPPGDKVVQGVGVGNNMCQNQRTLAQFQVMQ